MPTGLSVLSRAATRLSKDSVKSSKLVKLEEPEAQGSQGCSRPGQGSLEEKNSLPGVSAEDRCTAAPIRVMQLCPTPQRHHLETRYRCPPCGICS